LDDAARGDAAAMIDVESDIGFERTSISVEATIFEFEPPALETPIAAATEDGAMHEDGISAEEVDATLSADSDPEWLAALEAIPDPDRAPHTRLRRWAFGSIVLSLLLGLQVVHSFRAALASQPGVGSVLTLAYGMFGAELVPDWDLAQYKILDWAATAESAEAGAGYLRIRAQIRNNGPRAQPYPAIQLQLKDRWEAVVGSRMFEPGEYLARDVEAGSLMAAGETAAAELNIVDPGADAYGFELDVCVPAQGGRRRCAADRIFQ
jgi:hypothetical protein